MKKRRASRKHIITPDGGGTVQTAGAPDAGSAPAQAEAPAARGEVSVAPAADFRDRFALDADEGQADVPETDGAHDGASASGGAMDVYAAANGSDRDENHAGDDSEPPDAEPATGNPHNAPLDDLEDLGDLRADERYTGVPPIDSDYGLDADLSGFGVGTGFGKLDLDERDSMEGFMGAGDGYASLPNPEAFNAYPPEVQRKIMEWTDRDVRARRDDESRRQDAIVRARVEQARRKQMMPAIMVVLSLLCGAATGIVSGNPVFALVFVIIPVVVIVAYIVTDGGVDGSGPIRKGPRP